MNPGIVLFALAFSFSPLLAQEPVVPKPLDLLVQSLSLIENPDSQASILRGMNASLKGRHGLSAPAGWNAIYEKLKASPDEEVRNQAQALAVTFGGGTAVAEMRKALTDVKADEATRRNALDSLLAARDAETLPVLLDLVKQPGPLRATALRGLAEYDDPRIAGAVLGVFAGLDSGEKRDALNALVARPATARAVLAAIDAKTIARAEVSAPVARQLQDLHDPEIDQWLAKNWGAVRTSPADKQAQITRMKAFLSTDSILHADASRGRAIFTQTCAICHTLFGYGAKIGPELPGSFEDIDYLLLNIVDPDAIIGKDYQQVIVHTKDGQTLSGIIAADDSNAVSLKSLGGVVTVQRADIVSMEVSPHSLMPEGLITGLDEQSVRDLFLYLRQRAQVSMLATLLNAGDFFNGSDLTRWQASSNDAWKVENREIVGRGGAAQPTWLKSEMIAGEFKLNAILKVNGQKPVVEISYYGRPDQTPFVGETVSLGGNTGVNTWFYAAGAKPHTAGPSALSFPTGKWTKLEIVSVGDEFRLSIDGKVASFGGTALRPKRSGFAFYVLGADTELRMKDLKLEIPAR